MRFLLQDLFYVLFFADGRRRLLPARVAHYIGPSSYVFYSYFDVGSGTNHMSRV